MADATVTIKLSLSEVALITEALKKLRDNANDARKDPEIGIRERNEMRDLAIKANDLIKSLQ